MKHIALFGRTFDQGRAEAISILLTGLAEKDVKLCIYEPFYQKIKGLLPSRYEAEVFNSARPPLRCQAMVSIGGDGTLLEALTHVGNSGIPLMGINTGRLGFLTAFSKDEVGEAVDALLTQSWNIEKRTLLALHTEPNPFVQFPYALNEITLHKKDNSSMITLKVVRNGAMLNHYWADGLIISTATGSTGYSLSCGGPIILPTSENLIITPIAPHNLNVRPLVISDEDLLHIKAEVRGKEMMVSLDSRSAAVDALQEIEIRKAPFTLNLIRRKNQDFLQTIREKLMWGIDKRN
jgi:NAD+ kinase